MADEREEAAKLTIAKHPVKSIGAVMVEGKFARFMDLGYDPILGEHNIELLLDALSERGGCLQGDRADPAERAADERAFRAGEERPG